MKRLTLTITTENAAFADGNLEIEVAAILNNFATLFARGNRPEIMKDANGNTVGRIEYEGQI